MSRGPYWMPNARWGARMGDASCVDPVMGGLTDPFHEILMGVTAENLAERHSISREEQDAFAVESHRRASQAQADGRFDDEIVAVPVKVKRETVDFLADEHIRHDADAASMAQAQAGLQEGERHGHRRQRLGHERRRRRRRPDERGQRRRARRARARAHPQPTRPAASTRRTWASAPSRPCARCSSAPGRTLDEVGVIELNEAFAAQALAVMKELELDPAKVNPNGGAIALGHPIGATGSLITAKCLTEMERAGHELGIVTLCIGGGQGIALLLQRAE